MTKFSSDRGPLNLAEQIRKQRFPRERKINRNLLIITWIQILGECSIILGLALVVRSTQADKLQLIHFLIIGGGMALLVARIFSRSAQQKLMADQIKCPTCGRGLPESVPAGTAANNPYGLAKKGFRFCPFCGVDFYNSTSKLDNKDENA